MNTFSQIKLWFSTQKGKFLLAAFVETVFVSFFTLMPIIIGVIFLHMNSTYKGMSIFYQRGEFFLYSLSLFVSAHLVFNQYKAKPWELNSAFTKFSLIMLVLCSIIYATLSTLTTPNVEMIEIFSWTLMAIAVPSFFYSQFVSNRNSPDVAEIRRDEQKNIEDSLS